jgi:ubiquinone/menaquinone biosynthesis C-methylase UbiE
MSSITNEQQAASAFSKQSAVFDHLYASNTIIQYKRKRVRDHVEYFLKPGSSILELNAGTGEDAIYFANKGHTVHATDISEGMQSVLSSKARKAGLSHFITQENCSFTQLISLKNKGPYDFVFSNFAGLNCSSQLDKVLNSLVPLVKPDGMITLVILPRFCLWETLLVFKGKFKTAFRRFFSNKGVASNVEGESFKCWYYNPSYIIKNTKKDFRLLSIEGLCTIVPPSYIEHFAEKHPAAFSFLKKKENKYKSAWPWKYIGDYYIISLIRSSE